MESPRPISWAAVLALTGPRDSDKGKYKLNVEHWFADLANYLVTGELPSTPEISRAQRMKLKSEVGYYFWDDPYLWMMSSDQVLKRCILEWEQKDVLNHCHALACGDHFGPKKTARKVLDSGFYWPMLNKDAFELCQSCSRCQQTGGVSARDEISQVPKLSVRFSMFGDGLHGSLPIVIWEHLYTGCGGLCVQMDRGQSY